MLKVTEHVLIPFLVSSLFFLPPCIGGTGSWTENIRTFSLHHEIKEDIFADYSFYRNVGQIDDDSVLYHTTNMYFYDDSMVIRILRNDPSILTNRPDEQLVGHNLDYGMTKAQVFSMNLIQANRIVPRGQEEDDSKTSFFLGNDTSKWTTDAISYKKLIYENIYDNIDMMWYTSVTGIKYEFIIHPGGDIRDIQIKFKGAQVETIGKTLVLDSPIGSFQDDSIIFIERDGNNKTELPGHLKCIDNILSYDAAYDRTKTLIIDPIISSTLLGGSAFDSGGLIEISSDGGIYIGGHTDSINFPTTEGTYADKMTGNDDGFIVKLNSNCSEVLYSSFFGGSGYDSSRGMEIDESDNIYIVGFTNSSDFPVTNNGYDKTYNSGYDGFAMKFDPSLSSLVFSTYIGGSKDDEISSLGVDSSSNLFFTGSTFSLDFPVIRPLFCSTLQGIFDGFIARLNSSGSLLDFSSYIGGSGYDDPTHLCLDGLDGCYIVGSTGSVDFPSTTGAYDTKFEGSNEVFATKINLNGSRVYYSTFLNIGGYRAIVCAADPNGNLYIAGKCAGGMEITKDAYCSTKGSGSFIMKLDLNGSSLVSSTYLGSGYIEDDYFSLAVMNDSTPVLAGSTASVDFPTTRGAIQKLCRNPWDGFVIRFNFNLSNLIYSTLIGEDTGILDIAVDRHDFIYLTGNTRSNTYPTTPDAYDRTLSGNADGFVTKIWSYQPPSNPLNLIAESGRGYVQLNWSPPADTGGRPIIDYSIYRSLASGNESFSRRIGVESGFNDTSIQNGLSYYYAVSASNEIEEGDKSAIVKAYPGGVPTAPRNITAASGDGFIDLTWNPPADDGGFNVTNHRVYRGINPNGLNLFQTIGMGNQFQDSEVSNGVRYYYAVSALNVRGESRLSDTVRATPGRIPGPPGHLEANAQGANISLSWEPPADTGDCTITGYNIYRWDRPGNITNIVSTDALNTSWQDGSFQTENRYYYHVTVINDVGESGPSNEVSVYPNRIPSRPENLTGVTGAKSILLSWNSPVSDGGTAINEYIIYRGERIADRSRLATLAGGERSFLDKDITKGHRYYYHVAASNPVGEGPPSDTVLVGTDISAPATSIDEPAGTGFVNSTDIVVTGKAFDDLGVASVEISLDGSNWTRCSGTIEWSAQVHFPGSENKLYIRATDLWDNINITQKNITVDLLIPAITISYPLDHSILGERMVEVSGFASDNLLIKKVELSSDGKSWFPAYGLEKWSRYITLPLGHGTIFARAMDAAGNHNMAEANITVDERSPSIMVLKPRDRQDFESSTAPVTVPFSGSSSDDVGVAKVELSADGKHWVLATGTAEWRCNLSLTPGRYKIQARALDEAGKTAYANITIGIELKSFITEFQLYILTSVIFIITVIAVAWRLKFYGKAG